MKDSVRYRLKALDNKKIIDPEKAYQEFVSTQHSCYESDSQFTGIESIWFKKDNRMYKFIFEEAKIIDAYSENIL